MTDKESTGSKGFASRFSRNKPVLGDKSGDGKNTSGAGESGGGFAKKFASPTEKTSASFTENKSVLRSRTASTEGFAKATKRSRLDCLFLVRGKDRGKPAWHYVLVDKHKLEMFLEKSKSGSLDVALYGEILYSGWGENPPEDIVQKIKDEFGI